MLALIHQTSNNVLLWLTAKEFGRPAQQTSFNFYNYRHRGRLFTEKCSSENSCIWHCVLRQLVGLSAVPVLSNRAKTATYAGGVKGGPDGGAQLARHVNVFAYI